MGALVLDFACWLDFWPPLLYTVNAVGNAPSAHLQTTSARDFVFNAGCVTTPSGHRQKAENGPQQGDIIAGMH
jgi:hypothetical protein